MSGQEDPIFARQLSKLYAQRTSTGAPLPGGANTSVGIRSATTTMAETRMKAEFVTDNTKGRRELDIGLPRRQGTQSTSYALQQVHTFK